MTREKKEIEVMKEGIAEEGRKREKKIMKEKELQGKEGR